MHCLGSCLGRRPEHRWSSEWRRLGSTCLCAGPEGECSSHGSWFPWCQFPLFPPFPVGLAARVHVHLCCRLSYRSGRRFLQGQEFTVSGVNWTSVICFLDKHSTTEPHTPSTDLLCMLRPGGESHGWHFRRVSCMLCNQSQTVIPKTLGLIKIPVKSKDWLFDFVLCLKWERF